MGRLWAFFSFVYEAIRLTLFGRGGGGDNGGGDDTTDPDNFFVVIHYGCPNSNKSVKLQTERKTYR